MAIRFFSSPSKELVAIKLLGLAFKACSIVLASSIATMPILKKVKNFCDADSNPCNKSDLDSVDESRAVTVASVTFVAMIIITGLRYWIDKKLEDRAKFNNECDNAPSP